MATCSGPDLPRDTRSHTYDNLSDTIYGILPSRTSSFDLCSADLRASAFPAKHSQDTKSSSSKRKGGIFPAGHWIAPKGGKRTRLAAQNELRMELHQSTCLNLNHADDDPASDLWILPDFEEWEMEAQSPAAEHPMQQQGEWAPLVERAVKSNRERLRRRLEGDGWDFVGGKYGEDKGCVSSEDGSASEESVDEEFDVVVLQVVEVSS